MNEETHRALSALIFGFIVGMVLAFVLLICLSLSPKQVSQEYKNKAISLGYAKYILVTNQTPIPTVEFQWNTNH